VPSDVRLMVATTARSGRRPGAADPKLSPIALHVDNAQAPMDGSNRDPSDVDELAQRAYAELRRLAGRFMRRERPGQTLQATALVHEAYLRLARAGSPWHDERHFVGIAARAMRQILVERARARGALKRWAGLDRVSLNESLVGAANEDAMLPALDEALARLETIDPEQARIVELRYFVGLSIEDTARTLGMSPATLKRRWSLARAWLLRELSAPAV
jgi:RNA polymerase sigma factor (TIGR02999 family)